MKLWKRDTPLPLRRLLQKRLLAGGMNQRKEIRMRFGSIILWPMFEVLNYEFWGARMSCTNWITFAEPNRIHKME